MNTGLGFARLSEVPAYTTDASAETVSKLRHVYLVKPKKKGRTMRQTDTGEKFQADVLIKDIFRSCNFVSLIWLARRFTQRHQDE
jgi:hypothetical protein